jgi:hypothetical protein
MLASRPQSSVTPHIVRDVTSESRLPVQWMFVNLGSRLLRKNSALPPDARCIKIGGGLAESSSGSSDSSNVNSLDLDARIF